MDFFLQFTEGIDGIPSTCFYKKEIGKKVRLIGEPNEPMREVQFKIVTFLRKFGPKFPNATARRYGIGAVRNARKHTGKDFIFTLDFSNAFENLNGSVLSDIIAKRVSKCLRNVKTPTSEEWLSFLSMYALRKDNSLIRGAVTSGLLFDWYCEVMVDQPIRKLIYRHGCDITYTRYVDDLTFTTKLGYGDMPNPITHNFKRAVRVIIANAGFVENHRKTKVIDLKVNSTVKVTGARIGAEGYIGIGRKETKELEQLITFATGMSLFAPSPSVINGKVHYLLDVLRGKQTLNELEKRTLIKYVRWCTIHGIDSRWAVKTLENKSPNKTIRRKSKPK